jgi:hypothetical protein
MIVATFTLTDQAGDLSELLRADYHTVDFRMWGAGRFDQARARIPWARPVRHRVSRTLRTAEDQKGLACESLIASHAAACWTWFASRFPGRFSAESLVHPPTVRLLLTKESVPFKDHPRWFGPVGLAYAPEAWRSTDLGWAFKLGDWPRDWRHDDRFTATAAARREDAANAPGRSTIFTGDTISALTEGFAEKQSSLVACWAITCVMSLYADQLARLRDKAGKPRRVSRPVRQALDLDQYLIRDGLDASTVASDLRGFTMAFGRDVPEYSLDLDDSNPAWVRARTEPRELIPSLRERIRNQAGWLTRDMEATTGHIRASAELRQAIANTRLQRRILVLTVVTIAIAVISLVVALRTAGQPCP